jgi:hypothetical protein
MVVCHDPPPWLTDHENEAPSLRRVRADGAKTVCAVILWLKSASNASEAACRTHMGRIGGKRNDAADRSQATKDRSARV